MFSLPVSLSDKHKYSKKYKIKIPEKYCRYKNVGIITNNMLAIISYCILN
jgi:hypothetical protein